MAAPDVNQKAEIYETLSSLNMAFAGIIQHLHTLQRSGLFKSKTAKLFPSFAQELQAEFNQEFLEDLHQTELDDWERYGKAREKWEKHLRDPDDVFIHAKERTKQLAKQRKKKSNK
jgi:phosphatidylserine/phosphatidylglycerophosphate/cardiolipin synthase-like enzyme